MAERLLPAGSGEVEVTKQELGCILGTMVSIIRLLRGRGESVQGPMVVSEEDWRDGGWRTPKRDYKLEAARCGATKVIVGHHDRRMGEVPVEGRSILIQDGSGFKEVISYRWGGKNYVVEADHADVYKGC